MLAFEPLIEYEEQDFDSKHVFWFAGSYSEFPHSSDVCAGAWTINAKIRHPPVVVLVPQDQLTVMVMKED